MDTYAVSLSLTGNACSETILLSQADPQQPHNPLDTPPPDVVLYATTPETNPRYDVNTTISSSSTNDGLPEGWFAYTHPEGLVFYVNTVLKVVTDALITDVTVLRELGEALEIIGELKDELKDPLPNDYEIYLRRCTPENWQYYMVDHDTCTEFWAQDLTADQLDLPHAVSVNHMGHLLGCHYWMHQEYFPHRPIPDHLRLELIQIIRYSLSDQLTAADGTLVGWSVSDCNQFLRLLSDESSRCDNVYIRCIIARLWSNIERHRYDHYFGLPCARLSRDQRRLGEPHRQENKVLKAFSILLFRLPERLEGELDGLFVDRVVYVIHWEKFASGMTEKWKHTTWMAFALLIANAGLISYSRTYSSMNCGLGSLGTSSCALFISQALLYKNEGMTEITANEAANYLGMLEHPLYGFLPAAVIASAPNALIAWSIILLTTEVCSLILEHIESKVALIIVVAVIIGSCVAVVISLHRNAILSMCREAQRDDVAAVV
ncbi:hypothetical protein BXZ70DRAFT_1008189 [Cristinia sonorae]|uniref:Uncharacterized protein n=1 Tax=Cristinia sonorae TaxID=1940300 RepID=A0A8K0UPR9_9AGAR|nr:hypothetical protein BXZ70DRAFT_1008189 [Cristinia sonorae]